eukprot:3386889-Pyramimonas_sp.AAC.1
MAVLAIGYLARLTKTILTRLRSNAAVPTLRHLHDTPLNFLGRLCMFVTCEIHTSCATNCILTYSFWRAFRFIRFGRNLVLIDLEGEPHLGSGSLESTHSHCRANKHMFKHMLPLWESVARARPHVGDEFRGYYLGSGHCQGRCVWGSECGCHLGRLWRCGSLSASRRHSDSGLTVCVN